MTISKSKRQRETVGDYVEIMLDEHHRSYARLMDQGVFAFYDSRSTHPLNIQEISLRHILFKVPVMKHSVTTGRWKIVGNVPLEDELKIFPKFFKQDPLNLDRFSISEGGVEHRALRSDCIGLERLAVWDPTHVEDRLRDHYAGKSNKWVESLKIREPKKM